MPRTTCDSYFTYRIDPDNGYETQTRCTRPFNHDGDCDSDKFRGDKSPQRHNILPEIAQENR